MIELINATKRYGDKVALNDLNLKIKEPGIYCLLGRNGAGKTTFMKSVAGHINLSEGQIKVNGRKVSTFNMPNELNFIESQGAMFNMKIRELIKFSAMFSDNFDAEFANKMVKKFKLDSEKKYKKLSFGMKTMVSTLLSLSSNTKIVMLDEPVLGFDAVMREQFYSLLQESISAFPRIILISTHLIDEIAKVVENIIIIEEGEILDSFNIIELDEKAYAVTGKTEDVEKIVAGLKVTGRKVVGGLTSAFVFDKRIEAKNGCTIQPLGLQDYFLSLVGGEI